jgi:hypothetical protein
MSIEDNQNFQNDVNEKKDVVFTITMKSDGNITINGPLANKPMCLWMLEIGKGLMMAFNPNHSDIVKPRGNIVDFARKRFK